MGAMQELSLGEVRYAMETLKEQGITFDEAVLRMVQQHKSTWNEAADRLRGAEAMTGIYLEGDDLAATHDPAMAGNPPKLTGLNDGPLLPREAGLYVGEQDGAPGSKEASAQNPTQDSEPEGAPKDETLLCTICGQAIPEARARRQTATCSEKCKNRLDTIRAHQRASRRCPSCLHPSTQAEREAFRIWRAERGDIQTQGLVKRDRTLPNKEGMALALKRAARALQDERDTLAAQLAANPLETKAGAMTVGFTEKGRKQAEAKLERLTNLISDCEQMATPKGKPA